MAKPQIRLEPDVAKMVQRAAAKYGRTLPKEVNYTLRNYYATQSAVVSERKKTSP